MILFSPNKWKAFLAFNLYACQGFFTFLGFSLLYFGNFWLKLLAILILIYQYLLQTPTSYYRKIMQKARPSAMFQEYEVFYEDKSCLKEEKSLFGFHPHGMLTLGMLLLFWENKFFDSAVYCWSRAILNTPFMGFIARLVGANGVNPENFRFFMKKNKNICFVPGGFEEATITIPKRNRVFIRNRKGFIKYALEYGYSVHPVFTFGETDTYSLFTKFEKFRLFLNKIKLPGVILWSRNLIYPNDKAKLFTVIGKGVQFPKIDKPTKEDIDKYHAEYLENLINLYNKYKDKFGAKELEVF